MKNQNQRELTETLKNASSAYYGGAPFMSDIEFDKQLEALKQMEEESGVIYPGSPTQSVGAEVVSELEKARHEQPALSLDKVKYKNREDLGKWIGEWEDAVMMWKCDGLTVVLTYDDGKLTSAVTRGNGEEGQVITHNAKFFEGIPTQISFKEHLVLRGEAMMTFAEFDRIIEEGGAYENARNLASATIQMLDSNESRKRKINFKAFELVVPEPKDEVIDEDYLGDINLAYMNDRLDWLKSLGFDVVSHEIVDSKNYLSKIEEWKERIQDLPYPTDGLVFSYRDVEKGWKLGATESHPRWAIALKWTDETVETTIRDIEWSVGKTGLITPVAIFEERRLGLGSNVTRASLHNISIMTHIPNTCGDGNCVCGKGSKAMVYLANMIIPQIASCTAPSCEEPDIPATCPVCGSKTRIEESNGVQTLHCDNTNCPARQIGRLMNTFGKDGLFIKGLGESQLKDLIDVGLVDDVLSVYTLSSNDRVQGMNPLRVNDFSVRVEELMKKEGWGVKKWDNLISAIDASRKTTLQKFLYSLNIPLLGNDLSKKLSKFWGGDIEKFKDFIKEFVSVPVESRDDEAISEGIFESGFRTLSNIDGIGSEKATNILNWIEELTAYREKYEDFLSLIDELEFPVISEEASEKSDKSLEGLTFVITGSVHDYKNRDEFKASVEARGGKVAGSVSKNTTALVNNDLTSTSGKNQKAKELGIEIISEDEFISRYGR